MHLSPKNKNKRLFSAVCLASICRQENRLQMSRPTLHLSLPQIPANPEVQLRQALRSHSHLLGPRDRSRRESGRGERHFERHQLGPLGGGVEADQEQTLRTGRHSSSGRHQKTSLKCTKRVLNLFPKKLLTFVERRNQS